MTTQTEALKLALEALRMPSNYWNKTQFIKVKEAIAAAEEALAQQSNEQAINPKTTFNEVERGLQQSRMAIATLDSITTEQRQQINEPLLQAQLFLMAVSKAVADTESQQSNEQVEPVAVLFEDGSVVKYEDLEFVSEKSGQRIQMLYTHPPVPTAQPEQESTSQRYRFLLGFLIERGVLTNTRYSNGTWVLQGVYGVDDSGIRGAGRTAEEAVDNAVVANTLDPVAAKKFWHETNEALAQPEQEPVAVIGSDFQLLYCRDDWSKGLKVGDCLYTTPPQRKPLTDEEIAEFAERMEASDPTDSFWREFARAIEAAHGIKEKNT